jgi:putative peptide maturation dehydrogenase
MSSAIGPSSSSSRPDPAVEVTAAAPKIRRTVYLFFHCRDAPFLDVGQLLRGVVEQTSTRQLLAVSILRGEEVPVSDEEFELLSSIPSDRWIDLDDVPALAGGKWTRGRELAEKGLLLSTEDDPLLLELRGRDEQLAAGQWNIYAALYHSLTKWRDVDLRKLAGEWDSSDELPAPPDDAFERFVGRYGKPPPHFHSLGASSVHDLPLVERDEALFRLLRERRTTRSFDADLAITADQLSVVLYYVFGCHGYLTMFEDVVALKKTSPSGGALHPIEVYPLVTNVAGLEPGLYHYRAEDHVLESIEPLTLAAARELAREFTAGQSYFGSAGALFLLTARFYRSFWKYRKHERAYAVLLMDAAHLSQTLYLVCAQLGLGAFVTAAINGGNIDERLGLDGVSEGVLAVCGCGPPATVKSALQPDFVPYVPQR